MKNKQGMSDMFNNIFPNGEILSYNNKELETNLGSFGIIEYEDLLIFQKFNTKYTQVNDIIYSSDNEYNTMEDENGNSLTHIHKNLFEYNGEVYVYNPDTDTYFYPDGFSTLHPPRKHINAFKMIKLYNESDELFKTLCE